jgi:hypothetical protein
MEEINKQAAITANPDPESALHLAHLQQDADFMKAITNYKKYL